MVRKSLSLLVVSGLSLEDLAKSYELEGVYVQDVTSSFYVEDRLRGANAEPASTGVLQGVWGRIVGKGQKELHTPRVSKELHTPRLSNILFLDEVIESLEDLQRIFRRSRWSLATFADRGEGPYGGSRDYCYKLRHPLTKNVTKIWEASKFVKGREGGDAPECQLSALAMATAPETRWTSSNHNEFKSGERLVRVVILVTDSSFHQEGDYLPKPMSFNSEFLREGEGQRSGFQPDRWLQKLATVENLDYPSVAQVAEVLAEQDITPIYLVKPNVLSLYQKLALATNGVAVPLHEPTGVAAAVHSALHQLLVARELDCSGARCRCRPEKGDLNCDQLQDHMVFAFDDVPEDAYVNLQY